MECICITLSDGSKLPVIGCPACGAQALEEAKKLIEEACKKVPSCECSVCKPVK